MSFPPVNTCSAKIGFAQKSGSLGLLGNGGKRRINLKSMVFSEGGFHFRLRNHEVLLILYENSFCELAVEKLNYKTYIFGSVPTT